MADKQNLQMFIGPTPQEKFVCPNVTVNMSRCEELYHGFLTWGP